jgi:hypothetical protein
VGRLAGRLVWAEAPPARTAVKKTIDEVANLQVAMPIEWLTHFRFQLQISNPQSAIRNPQSHVISLPRSSRF